jgi:hypothetical protein
MKELNGNASMANRVSLWVAIVALGIYVMNMGQWVGAADEKLKDAEAVEEQVDDIKDRLTALETTVDTAVDTMKENKKDILDAIKELKDEVKDNDG